MELENNKTISYETEYEEILAALEKHMTAALQGKRRNLESLQELQGKDIVSNVLFIHTEDLLKHETKIAGLKNLFEYLEYGRKKGIDPVLVLEEDIRRQTWSLIREKPHYASLFQQAAQRTEELIKKELLQIELELRNEITLKRKA